MTNEHPAFQWKTTPRLGQFAARSSSRMGLKAGLAIACLRKLGGGRNEGSALVEMAVVVPLMMVLITGMCSMGLSLNSYLALSHAADVGARYIALSQGNFTNGASNPCAMGATQIQAAGPTLVPAKISYTIALTPTSSGTTTTFSSSNGAGSFGSGSSCGTSGTGDMGSGGGTVSVTLSYPVQLLIFGWSPATLNLQASTTEIIQ